MMVYGGMMVYEEAEEVVIVYEEVKMTVDTEMLTLPVFKNFSVSRKIIIFAYFYKFFNTKIIFIYLKYIVDFSELVTTCRMQ